MSNINSSGSVERFTLAAGESKSFRNQALPYGAELGNNFVVDVHGDEDQTFQGLPQDMGSAQVKLQTSEDGTSYSDVATVTVVGRGKATLSGAVGAYGRVLNVAGPGLAHIVLKPLNPTQVVPAL